MAAGCNWSESEDRALKTYYPRHGRSWKGWREVLPDRTEPAIAERARRLGIRPEVSGRGSHRHEISPEPQERPRGDRWHYAVVPTRPTKDPYEAQVVRYMNEGMTPTEIDRKMGWFRGSARLIMSNRWARLKEQASREHDEYHGRGWA